MFYDIIQKNDKFDKYKKNEQFGLTDILKITLNNQLKNNKFNQ